jgi:hypothetical protein
LEHRQISHIPPELLGGALYDFAPDNIQYEEYLFKKKKVGKYIEKDNMRNSEGK